MEKWVVVNKGADFAGIGKRFGIDPVTARVIRNRGLTDEAEIERYLNGTLGDLCDPHLLKDADLLVDILLEKIKEHAPIRIIGDYDIDGVMSSYILVKALRRAGAEASVRIPDRIADGYGLNEHLITQARDEGMDTILTCDNGIAALDEIALAKSLGMTVLVTDHHEIPFTEENGVKIEKKSLADAIVNPHQAACTYPNKNLCGAAVAWKVVCILFERLHIAKEEAESFLTDVFASLEDKPDLTNTKILERIIMRSCKSAVKGGDILKKEEIDALMDSLKKCVNPFSCPHGRPTFIRMTEYEIRKMFRRV